MSTFIKHMVIGKLKNIKAGELLSYSREYGFDLRREEAEEIANYLKTAEINPFDADGRADMLRKLAAITDTETAKKANHLFMEMIRSYGVEHLFRD